MKLAHIKEPKDLGPVLMALEKVYRETRENRLTKPQTRRTYRSRPEHIKSYMVKHDLI